MTFADKVFASLARVPAGKVITYQDLARVAGKPRAYRAVGTILNHNPHLIIVPCHRVVKSSGEVGKYVNGQDQKIFLLKQEGVQIDPNLKVNLTKYKYYNLYVKKNQNCCHARAGHTRGTDYCRHY